MADLTSTIPSCKTAAIVPAAGDGKRMKRGVRKPFLLLQGKPILAHTLDLLERNPLIECIWIAGPREELSHCHTIVSQYRFTKIVDIVIGGETRQESVRNALKKIGPEYPLILVHDAVRPLCPPGMIQMLIEKAAQYGASILTVPVKDTIKQVRDDGFVETTLDRGRLRSTQTPQVFRAELLRKAFDQADKDHFSATDEAALMERLPEPVFVLEGSYENIKITTPEDLVLAELILTKRAGPADAA